MVSKDDTAYDGPTNRSLGESRAYVTFLGDSTRQV